MNRICRAFLILGLSLTTRAFAADEGPSCGPGDEEGRAMAERLNQRYDDFFRRQREVEEQERRRESAASEATKLRRQREEELRKAAAEYRRSKPVIDPRLEEQWNEQDKQWKSRIELARRCLVEKRNAVKALQRKGRTIPEMKEYDLEND
jgi:hypothetical protein